MNSNKDMKYRSDIDGLRAVAVMSVIFFHYSIGNVFTGGYVGVDIFFVISGYLITSIIYSDITKGTYSITDFYHRRVRRIFPALFVIFIACLIASFLMNFPSETQDIGKSIASSIFFVSNILFYTSSSYFDHKMELNPVLHTWSLSVEEQFYVLFPILVYSMRTLSHKKRLMVLLIFSLASFAASAVQVYIEPTAAFYLVPFRAWELLMGSLLALKAFPSVAKPWQIESISGLGLVLIASSLIFYSKSTPFPGLAAFIPCAGATAIIYAGGLRKTFVSNFLGLPPIRFIGLISYSLYLWHWPIWVYTRINREPSGLAEKLSLVALCIIIATLSWWFIERPFRKAPYRLSVKSTLAVASASMASVATLAFFMGTISSQFWQLPIRVEKILAYTDATEHSKETRVGTCFLTSEFNSFEYYKKEECLNLSNEKKNILIVGDSHAAHLWPGFQAVYPQINFIQATASGCKPIIDTTGDKRCTDMIDYIFNVFLPKNHVDAVILSGRWNTKEVTGAISTASKLREYAGNVVISGPIVEYDQPLPRILARSVAEHTDENEFAARHRRTQQKQTDELFIKSRLPNNVKYVSVYNIMCSQKCRLWTENNVPAQFDYGHLTKEGAAFLVKQAGLAAYGAL
jgi:peptidoglycan/LPS O-acetylase OafA/YrhL